MYRRFIFVALTVWYSLSGSLAAPIPVTHTVDSLIQYGIMQTFRCRFDSAMTTFQCITDLMPDHPAGYCYQASLLQFKMMDYETDQWESRFFALCDTGIQKGKKLLASEPDNAWHSFFVGSIYNYTGLYLARSGDLVNGFVHSKKAVAYLEKAVELDPSLYDAYLGIGNYMYWSGRATKFLKWLPFVGDARKEGIRMVHTAMNRGRYSRWTALSSLAWIEYDRNAYNKAFQLFTRGITQFPGSRFFLWGLADTRFRMNDFAGAATLYEMILSDIIDMAYDSPYNEVICRFKLVKTYDGSGRYDRVIEHAEAILNMNLDQQTNRRVEDRIKQTRSYYRNAKKKQHSEM